MGVGPDIRACGLVALDLARTADDGREHFWCILLDAQLRHLLHAEVSVGTLNASLVHPREVLGPALREGAASLVLAHNHPTGDPTPSREDIRLTRQIVDAGKLLDVPIHDHVKVAPTRFEPMFQQRSCFRYRPPANFSPDVT